MVAPRLERIRPCLHCGALLSFSALRCGECGTAQPGAPTADEQVRPCLQCGVILRFDQDPCPQCGAKARDEADDRVKACVECSALVPFEQLYCARCGELSIPIETDQIPPDVALDEADAPSARLPALLGGIAFAIGVGTLLIAAVEVVQ